MCLSLCDCKSGFPCLTACAVPRLSNAGCVSSLLHVCLSMQACKGMNPFCLRVHGVKIVCSCFLLEESCALCVMEGMQERYSLGARSQRHGAFKDVISCPGFFLERVFLVCLFASLQTIVHAVTVNKERGIQELPCQKCKDNMTCLQARRTFHGVAGSWCIVGQALLVSTFLYACVSRQGNSEILVRCVMPHLEHSVFNSSRSLFMLSWSGLGMMTSGCAPPLLHVSLPMQACKGK